ncbi:MAG: ribosomal L7Ae/L30e/S12e/Gadd45 family protein [Clostridiales bacterium]|nr:ribosomal L7Ae/L30e/S12e/Gadd45 family protein [Clostridiales bacterium]
MDDNGLLGIIGLARKAGKLHLGEESAAAAALDHKTRLILVASDAAENTAQRIRRAAETGNAVCLSIPHSKEELGGAVGRKSCAVAAFSDVGLAAAAVRKLAGLDPQQYGEAARKLSHKAEKTDRRRRERRQREKEARSARPWSPPPKGKL